MDRRGDPPRQPVSAAVPTTTVVADVLQRGDEPLDVDAVAGFRQSLAYLCRRHG